MIEVALMIEGQDGLTWDRWQRIVRVAEDAGFVGLFRSDHFTNAEPPDKDALECWTSLTWLASHTTRIEFGPLVSPVSFRHPAMLARMAAAVDDLSQGRLRLGVGAGWQEREHNHFGYELLGVRERFQRLHEGLEVLTRWLHSDQPVTFEGRYFRLREAVLLPRPGRARLPIVLGGNGRQLTLPLAARYADEWNATFQSPEGFKERSLHLDELLRQQGRRPDAVRRSLMTGVRFGRDAAEVRARLGGRSAAELRQHGYLLGTPSEIRDQLAALDAAGVERVMLQWLDLDDLDGMQALARAIR